MTQTVSDSGTNEGDRQTAYASTNIESDTNTQSKQRVHHPKHKNSNPILKSGLSSPYL